LIEKHDIVFIGYDIFDRKSTIRVVRMKLFHFILEKKERNVNEKTFIEKKEN